MSELFFRSSLMMVTTILGLLPTLALAEENPRETPLVRAVRESRKSVVNIHTEKSASEDKDARFFTARPRKVTGMGTGIVVDERGYIVTNYHVIQDVDLISVTIHGGSTYEGHPVSYDRKHDLAIIRIAAKDPLAVMPMGTSSDLMLLLKRSMLLATRLVTRIRSPKASSVLFIEMSKLTKRSRTRT